MYREPCKQRLVYLKEFFEQSAISLSHGENVWFPSRCTSVTVNLLRVYVFVSEMLRGDVSRPIFVGNFVNKPRRRVSPRLCTRSRTPNANVGVLLVCLKLVSNCISRTGIFSEIVLSEVDLSNGSLVEGCKDNAMQSLCVYFGKIPKVLLNYGHYGTFRIVAQGVKMFSNIRHGDCLREFPASRSF